MLVFHRSHRFGVRILSVSQCSLGSYSVHFVYSCRILVQLSSLRIFKLFGGVELPPWTDIVKTARFEELAPYDPDWYHVRVGSL
ncbi:hypothetical protein ACFX16_045469 [Malus domestica]